MEKIYVIVESSNEYSPTTRIVCAKRRKNEAKKLILEIFNKELIPYIDSVDNMDQLDIERNENRLFVSLDYDYYEIRFEEVLLD